MTLLERSKVENVKLEVLMTVQIVFSEVKKIIATNGKQGSLEVAHCSVSA